MQNVHKIMRKKRLGNFLLIKQNYMLTDILGNYFIFKSTELHKKYINFSARGDFFRMS